MIRTQWNVAVLKIRSAVVPISPGVTVKIRLPEPDPIAIDRRQLSLGHGQHRWRDIERVDGRIGQAIEQFPRDLAGPQPASIATRMPSRGTRSSTRAPHDLVWAGDDVVVLGIPFDRLRHSGPLEGGNRAASRAGASVSYRMSRRCIGSRPQ